MVYRVRLTVKQCFTHVNYLHATFKCLASYTSNSVVSCTAVYPRRSSVDVWKIPSCTLVQYFTITTILQHSGPGDFGVGLPVASQTKVMFDPSGTVWSRLTLVSLAGTENSDGYRSAKKRGG